jgi:hypothetical protein
MGEKGKAKRIAPNKGRKLQVAPTGRKLFTEKLKSEFLEWFAATCNASLSARKVGIDYRTAFRHRREDPVFGAGWDEALRIGYVRLEEIALREAEKALKRRPRVRGPSAPPAKDDVHWMDPTIALQLLREHKRSAGGASGQPGQSGKSGRAPTVASNAEVMDALVKRLKAYGIRIGKDGNPR